MAESTKATEIYAMGRTEAETQRLIRQAQRFAVPLRRLFEDAGLAPGMRVLDLGSGAGDVAMLAAQMVGPTSSVVGVDQNPAILELARRRVREAGLSNISFLGGDLREDIALPGDFDALVGRFVLTYAADPVAMLRPLVRNLRPGAIVAVAESAADLSYVAHPPSRLLKQTADWHRAALHAAGADHSVGLRLYHVLLEAGLTQPQLRVTADVVCGPDWNGYASLADGLRSLVPVIEQFSIASVEEVGIDTLAERLRQEFVRERKVAMGLMVVDAWARKP
jgi:ubiquinone/menaquinone biosynthesis C-methylase UbiE